jgi:hypothetical protein
LLNSEATALFSKGSSSGFIGWEGHKLSLAWKTQQWTSFQDPFFFLRQSLTMSPGWPQIWDSPGSAFQGMGLQAVIVMPLLTLVEIRRP